MAGVPYNTVKTWLEKHKQAKPTGAGRKMKDHARTVEAVLRFLYPGSPRECTCSPDDIRCCQICSKAWKDIIRDLKLPKSKRRSSTLKSLAKAWLIQTHAPVVTGEYRRWSTPDITAAAKAFRVPFSVLEKFICKQEQKRVRDKQRRAQKKVCFAHFNLPRVHAHYYAIFSIPSSLVPSWCNTGFSIECRHENAC